MTDIRVIIATAWLLPLAAVGGLLYYDLMMAAVSLPETNRAMRERMCREHVDLARNEPENDVARTAIGECVTGGYLTRADGLHAID
jgi:hypothetical protein